MARAIFLLLVALVFGAQTGSSSSGTSTLLGAPGANTLGTIGSTLSNPTGTTGSSSQSIVAKPSSSSASRSPSTIIVCDLVDQTGTLTNVDEVCTSGGLR
jgi:hypothetical protein